MYNYLSESMIRVTRNYSIAQLSWVTSQKEETTNTTTRQMDDCAKWRDRPDINPRTGRQISLNGRTAKALRRQCGQKASIPRRRRPTKEDKDVVDRVNEEIVTQPRRSSLSFRYPTLISKRRPLTVGKDDEQGTVIIHRNKKPRDKYSGDYEAAIVSAARMIARTAQPFEETAYKRIGVLGEGAFGDAFHVQSIGTGEDFALKRFSKRGRSSFSTIVNEVAILRAFGPGCHPYVVCYAGFLQDRENYYILMKLAEGRSLETLMQESAYGPSAPRDWDIKVISMLCLGLSAIHAKNIAHRDVKPSNLFVNEQTGIVTYLDFGLACLEDECKSVRPGGTRSYMSPQLRSGRQSGHTYFPSLSNNQADDIYALGVIIVELLRRWPSGQFARLDDSDKDRTYALRQTNAKLISLGMKSVVDQLVSPFASVRLQAFRILRDHIKTYVYP
jgi:serine/threonine protein kinase